MQRKLIAAAKAAAAGKTAAERKRLFLEAAAGTTVERTLDELGKAEAGRVRRSTKTAPAPPSKRGGGRIRRLPKPSA